MNRFVVATGAALWALAVTFTSQAQAVQASGGAASSTSAGPGTRPVPIERQLWRKAMWRTLDLREPANRPLFARGHWLTSVLVAAVRRGELTPYRTDSCVRELPRAEFLARLRVPGTDTALSAVERAIAADDTPWPTAAGAVPVPPRGAAGGAAGGAELLPRQLWQVELKEQVTFDQRHSRLKHVIEALTVVVPATETAKGFDLPLASFRYEDLVRVFRAHPAEAIWFNPRNSARHLNLADAFDLWLFQSRITKVENPDDKDLVEMAGGARNALFAGQQAAADLIDFEDGLWSH